MTKEEIRQAAQDWDGSGLATPAEEGAFIKGAEWIQERMIEEAEKWLSNNMFHSINNGVQINGICVSDFIERFKKAMQDESK
jgi:hypothetical protein